MGKQREEYKKLKAKKASQLDQSRIDRLNEIGFQWTIQNWTITTWDDRYQVSIPHVYMLYIARRELSLIGVFRYFLDNHDLISGTGRVQGEARSREDPAQPSALRQLASLSKGPVQDVQGWKKVEIDRRQG